MITLNQIVQELKEFARKHGQLSTAKFSRQYELQEGGDIRYQALFFDVGTMRKQRGLLIMPFTAWIVDLVRPDRTNIKEVWNDTTLIALDLLAYLDNGERDYALQDNAPIKPFFLVGPDMTAGVQVDFVLEIPFAANACITPQKTNGFLLTEDGEYITQENDGKIELEK
jgi:hypothetical protein